jgi:predicted dithiol-disulfide oxidoreductase (DUF899 family)
MTPTQTMQTPPIVSPEDWHAAHQQMLVKEKAFTQARDALAAERRRMPWMAIDKAYEFEGPQATDRLPRFFRARCARLAGARLPRMLLGS